MTGCGCACHITGTSNVLPHDVPGCDGTCGASDALLCLLCGKRRHQIGVCCTKCRDNLEWRLNDIQELYALLPDLIQPGSGNVGGGKHQKRDAGPLPGVEAVMNLLGRSNPDDAVHMAPGDDARHDQGGPLPTLAVLGSWVRLVCEERQFAGRDTYASVTSEASFLRRHLDWICGQQWVDDFAAEITRAHNTLRDVAGEHRPQKIGTCPAQVGTENEPKVCGAELYVSTYSDTVVCRSCGETWTRDRWRWLGQTMGLIA